MLQRNSLFLEQFAILCYVYSASFRVQAHMLCCIYFIRLSVSFSHLTNNIKIADHGIQRIASLSQLLHYRLRFLIAGCAATVVTMTSKVNGKTGILTPCRSKTPENFITKIGHIDYVVGATRMPTVMGIGPRMPAPQIAKI